MKEETLKNWLLKEGLVKTRELFVCYDKSFDEKYHLPIYELGNDKFIECDILVDNADVSYMTDEFMIELDNLDEDNAGGKCKELYYAKNIIDSGFIIIFHNDNILISENEFNMLLQRLEENEEDKEMLEDIEETLTEMGASDEILEYVIGLNKIALNSMADDEYTIDDLYIKVVELENSVNELTTQNKSIYDVVLKLGGTTKN